MEAPPPDNATGAWHLTPSVVASTLVAVGAIFVGVLVLAGWLYTRTYYRQFGIEPSALEFSPYEYALRARFGLGFALSMVIGLTLGVTLNSAWASVPESHWLYAFRPTPAKTKGERIVRSATLLVYAGSIVGIGLIDWFFLKRGLYVISIVLGLGLWSAIVMSWFLQRKKEMISFGVASLIAVLAAFVLYVPGARGETDGRRDRHDLGRFPAVSLVAVRDLGIPHDEAEGTFHKYGPYRLVLRNNGMYYLIAEEEPNETMAVPEGSITYVQIHND